MSDDMKIRHVRDVVAWRSCVGCGACAYACPDEQVALFDFLEEGIRPVVDRESCGTCRDCLEVCPAYETDFSAPPHAGDDSLPSEDLRRHWGTINGIWEGRAADATICFEGSSGGALTALAAFCLEQENMYGVLHTAQDPDDAIRNRTRLSRSRAALLSAAGSRYSPGSVCDGLGLVENAPGPCAVIGQPAEIAATTRAIRLRPELDAKIGVTFSFFCAGSPPTAATVELLRRLEVDPSSVADLRYRGRGWPGHFAPIKRAETAPVVKLTYAESWAFLQAYRPWSVQMWPDGSGELADITCGDPWYEQPDGKNPGFSLIVTRTPRGKALVERAIAAGYLEATPAETWKLSKSQPGLLAKKGSIGGRRFAQRMVGLPVSRFPGLDLFACWRTLSWRAKARSVFGTWRRILTRKLFRPLQLNRARSVPVPRPFVRD